MACVCGSEVPEQLYYDVDEHVWLRPERDGTLTIGLSSHGFRHLGTVSAFSPRKVGQSLKAGMSCATLQSLDWVEPVRCPVAGEVVEVNQAAVEDPALISRWPHDAGWLVRIQPECSGLEEDRLLKGREALAAYSARCCSELAEG